MRYLMDSLQSYETGHSNALCPIPREADKSFMGDHLLLKPVDTGEFRLFTSQILKSLGDITSGAQSGFRITTGTMADIGGASAQFPSSSQLYFITELDRWMTSGVNPNIAIPHIETAVLPTKKVNIIPGVYIPDLTKNDFAWKEAHRLLLLRGLRMSSRAQKAWRRSMPTNITVDHPPVLLAQYLGTNYTASTPFLTITYLPREASSCTGDYDATVKTETRSMKVGPGTDSNKVNRSGTMNVVPTFTFTPGTSRAQHTLRSGLP
ncbi:hypothetical protein B0H11DRAFT_1932093 [Mycena galericulata]|nr:hypothetical protein B0H11DRAFT_1932093 [Mycena galericulata]